MPQTNGMILFYTELKKSNDPVVLKTSRQTARNEEHYKYSNPDIFCSCHIKNCPFVSHSVSPNCGKLICTTGTKLS